MFHRFCLTSKHGNGWVTVTKDLAVVATKRRFTNPSAGAMKL